MRHSVFKVDSLIAESERRCVGAWVANGLGKEAHCLRQYILYVYVLVVGSDWNAGEVSARHHSQVERQGTTQVGHDDAGEAASHLTRAATRTARRLSLAAAEQQACRLPPHSRQTAHLLAQRRGGGQGLWHRSDTLPQGWQKESLLATTANKYIC